MLRSKSWAAALLPLASFMPACIVEQPDPPWRHGTGTSADSPTLLPTKT
jgi:hypothetical protein